MTVQSDISKLMRQFESFGILEHSLPNAIGMWEEEQRCLLWLLLNSDPNTDWAEIGSFCGGSTALMCLTYKFLGGTGHVISIDIDYNLMFDLNIYQRGGFQNLHTKLGGNSSILHNIRPIIDFAFIDGFHSFRQALTDFENILPYLTQGGKVLFHDVSPYLYESTHFEKTYLETMTNIDRLMESTDEDFCLDEVITFICKKYEFHLVDFPVRTNDKHFRETRLNKWVKGTTSPFNSLGAITR